MNARLLVFAAALLVLPFFAGTAAADPLAHDCQGAVDVHCHDRTHGSCAVWVFYLDIVLPDDNGPVFCQESPYA